METRALHYERRGREFKSLHGDQFVARGRDERVWAETLRLESGRGTKLWYGWVAQQAEHSAEFKWKFNRNIVILIRMKQKRCSKCGKLKKIEDFPYENKKTGLRRSRCNICRAPEMRKHYEENKEYYVNKARAWRRNRRIELKTLILQYLKSNPCIDCGEADPVVLEFDHVRGRKELEVAKLVHKAVSKDHLVSEINKCEVRCANCHRRRHARLLSRSGSWDGLAIAWRAIEAGSIPAPTTTFL
jgi:hypothetical protein